MIDFLYETPLSAPLIFDSHAHYDDSRFTDIKDELLNQLPKSGVGGVITCGCDVNSSKSACEIAENYDYIYFSAGIHPEFANNFEDSLDTSLLEIGSLAKHKKCLAIGEIGLDYYWEKENKEFQKKIFEEQLKLANSMGLPVIIHDREAHSDTLKIISKYKPKGVLHSFSGSPEMANEVFKLGMYIGIGGVVTFKNSKKLPEIVKEMPLDSFLLETDAPYLTPEPYRSKTNNSAMIYFTAKKIAEIRDISLESVLKLSFENAERLFIQKTEG